MLNGSALLLIFTGLYGLVNMCNVVIHSNYTCFENKIQELNYTILRLNWL